MPKIKKIKRHTVVSAQPYTDPDKKRLNEISLLISNKIDKIDKNNDINDKIQTSSSLSRGQRKRQIRKEKIMMKMGKTIIKSNMNTIQNGGNIHSSSAKLLLSELESTLNESINNDDNDGNNDNNNVIRSSALSVIKSNKMKKDIAVREATRMKLVQNHPAFKTDPIKALKAHLEQMTSIKKNKTIANS